MKIKQNDQAIDFKLADQDGKFHQLSDYKGKYLLLYFYPKDNTPGCTTEACSIRDAWDDFAKYNAVVLGVSPDSVESHQKFSQKFSLPFSLLADPEKKLLNAYGVWVEKSMFGNKYMGVKRSSVLIGPDGKVAKIYESASPKKHAAQVLEDLKKLNS
jgi:peroxiredoxin Q/BCP